MKITVQVSGVEQVISISQIRTIQVIDENTTRLSFYNGRKNVKGIILNQNLETFVSEIQKVAGDKTHIPFSGKKSVTKKDGLKLTRQVVELDWRDGDPSPIEHLFNSKGEFLKEKSVTDIYWDEQIQRICGHVKVYGSFGVLVYTDEVESINDIEIKRYNWWRYKEQPNKAA